MRNQILEPIAKILTAAAIILALAGVAYIAHLRAERENLEQRLSSASLTIKSYERQAAADKAALADREYKVRQLAQARDDLDAQRREIYATDCEAAAWADAYMPDDVYSRLQAAVP